MASKKPTRSPIKIYSLLLFLLVLLVSLGSGLQVLAENLDRVKNPPPGKLVKMDSYSLYIHCSGQGSPTVILESDLSYPSLQWALVQRELSQQTKVCSYDRAALGWSEASPIPRKGQEMAAELFRLLRKANVESPYILVGYNRGTWLTRLFAYQYPEIVDGIVLIAPYPEDMDHQIKTDYRENQSWSLFTYRLMTPVTWLGITRLSITLGGMDWFTKPYTYISQDVRLQILDMTAFRTAYWSPAADELAKKQEIIDEIQLKKNLGKIPLWILVSPQVHFNSQKDQLPQEVIKNYDKLLNDLAGISTTSVLVNCESCGIMPPITSPEQVIAIIQQAITQTAK